MTLFGPNLAKMTSKKLKRNGSGWLKAKPCGDTSKQTTAGVAVANLNDRVSSEFSAVASEGFLF